MGSTSTRSGKNKIKNYISWFEIPVLDLQRAVDFYNRIYEMNMEIVHLNGYSMAFFTTAGGTGGALVMGQGCSPSECGTLVYLNGGDNLNQVLERIEQAGGRVIMEKSKINDDSGYFALFIDSEGNRLALHSNN